MPLDFPTSPTDGQIYTNWIYSTSKGAWKSRPLTAVKTITADVPPASPSTGDQWFNTLDGTLYIYVTDVDGSQWVESRAPITADGYTSPNYILNGGFDVWQRGTSFAPAADPNSGTFSADRWRVAGGGATNLARTFTRQLSGLTGFQYCARAQRDSTRTGTVATGFLMDLESVTSIPLASSTVTLSFYARAGANFSAASSVLGTSIYTGTGADQNLTTGYTGSSSQSKSHTLTTGWTRFSQTVTLPATTTQVGLSFLYTPVGTAGTSDFFEVTGVQLETGGVASPFRRNANSIQGELAACQRYYYRVNATGTSSSFGLGLYYSTTAFSLNIKFPVSMRAAPATLESSAVGTFRIVDGVSAFTVSAIAFYPNANADVDSTLLNITSSASTQGKAANLVDNTNPSYLGFSAEL